MKVQRQFVVSEATQRDTVGRNRVEVLDENTFEMSNLIKCQMKFSSDNFDKLTHVLYVGDGNQVYLIKFRVMEVNPYSGTGFDQFMERIKFFSQYDCDDVYKSDIFRAMYKKASKNYTREVSQEEFTTIFSKAENMLNNLKHRQLEQMDIASKMENTEIAEEEEKAVDNNDN